MASHYNSASEMTYNVSGGASTHSPSHYNPNPDPNPNSNRTLPVV